MTLRGTIGGRYTLSLKTSMAKAANLLKGKLSHLLCMTHLSELAASLMLPMKAMKKTGEPRQSTKLSMVWNTGLVRSISNGVMP